MKNQKGFTVIELMIVIGALGVLSCIVAVVWVAFHFISKYW
jgi:prepilin-type N-terminal cleavage/methylation domain-containing protein